jgi:hypothetical protein
MEALAAEARALAQLEDRAAQGVRVLARDLEQVEREALRGLPAYAGELAQLGDHALDGWGEVAQDGERGGGRFEPGARREKPLRTSRAA